MSGELQPPDPVCRHCGESCSGTCEQARHEAEVDRHVERVLKATVAVDQWQRAHGVIFGKVIGIACPICSTEDALQFTQTKHHLYCGCTTPNCIPHFRGNCRGRKWPK